MESINHNLKLGVIGGGYVGLVTGGCFSYFGYDVSIVEIDPKKVETLNRGELPIYEPGLGEIIKEARSTGRLNYFTNYSDFFSQKAPDLIFIAVGTPDRPDGSCNMDYVMGAVKDVVKHAKNDLVLILKSTVPVGTAKQVKSLIQELNPKHKIAVVNNPEFLKEGEAVADFMRPARVVIGGTEDWALNKVKSLYEPLLHNGHPLFVTDHETAELGKLSANLALASRVSLINQISRLAAAAGANIRQVERILRSDPRIGSRYLFAGLGYGGSCFPKDVKSFIHLCKSLNVDASFAEETHQFNETQKIYFIPDIKKTFTDVANTTICLLGVAFKPNTDDIREAPALKITEELSALGYKIQAFDPKGLDNYKQWLDQNKIQTVKICKDSADALKNANAVIVAAEWQEFQRLGFGPLKHIFSGKKVYDGKNIYNPARIREMGFEYLGVGQS